MIHLPGSVRVYLCLLAVIRKRRFLDVRRQGRGGLAQFEAEVVEVIFRRRMGAEFVDDGSEVGQRADRGQVAARLPGESGGVTTQGATRFPQRAVARRHRGRRRASH